MNSLGGLDEFYEQDGEFNLESYQEWLKSDHALGVLDEIAGWLGQNIEDVNDVNDWVGVISSEFENQLVSLRVDAEKIIAKERDHGLENMMKLLHFLFDVGVLPTYAFPTNLAAFRVETWDSKLFSLVTKYQPQQSIRRALSEYAPGRLITIDKQNYKCQVVTAETSAATEGRAEPLFTDPHRKPYVFCSEPTCSYVEDIADVDLNSRLGATCKLCDTGKLTSMEMITPEVFMPRKGTPINELEDEQEYSISTPAQFPVPLNYNPSMSGLVNNLSGHLSVYHEDNAELVVVNKGDREQLNGFYVCSECGSAQLATQGPGPDKHERPYHVIPQMGRPPIPNRKCNGEMKNVFLGSRFKTDLLVIRANIQKPLAIAGSTTNFEYKALNDALQTLADTLPLAVARRYDLDPAEFTSGYRLIVHDGFLAELFMFDDVSGGAGYSQRAGEIMEDLLNVEVRDILKCESNKCDRSCYRCLRHYHNQMRHHVLDRNLAMDLLNILQSNIIPGRIPIDRQKKLLKGLAQMAEFEGCEVEWDMKITNDTIPLVLDRNGNKIGVYVRNSLLDPNSEEGLDNSIDTMELSCVDFNEYRLTRNLPDCYAELRQCHIYMS